MTDPALKLRLDKWLWQARFFKTRSLASKLVSAGHVRVNANKTDKPAHAVMAGDVLTFPQGDRIRVVRLIALGTRRGPAPEAHALYEDMSPEETKTPQNPSFEGGGRPGKKDRRKLDLLRSQMLE